MRTHSRSVSEPLFAEPLFNEDRSTPDPNYFEVPHPNDNPLYNELHDLHLDDAQPFDKSRLADGDLFDFAKALGSAGSAKAQQIRQAGKIVFHAVGDTGSVKTTKTQNLVADALVAEYHVPAAADRPAFFFHLGDVVYSFSESQYYYDQFYEPYRNYPGPIFAIAGNHDGLVSPLDVDRRKSLETFQRNFCADRLQITPDAVTLHRTAMTQPGVYFTLDVPCVRIIGLYSNAMEDPGVISSQGGKYSKVPAFQLAFLKAQLARIKDEKYAGCVLLAVHHPPFSWVSPEPGRKIGHGGSPKMLQEIDQICKAVGVYPHAFLSGHAHNYQRYTRFVRLGSKQYDVPFIVAGAGGHAVNSMVRKNQPHPEFRTQADHLEPGLLLEKFNDMHYGYLRITVDADTLHIGYRDVEIPSFHQAEFDAVTVDLKTHEMISN